jgi:hypothetical protein
MDSTTCGESLRVNGSATAWHADRCTISMLCGCSAVAGAVSVCVPATLLPSFTCHGD